MWAQRASLHSRRGNENVISSCVTSADHWGVRAGRVYLEPREPPKEQQSSLSQWFKMYTQPVIETSYKLYKEPSWTFDLVVVRTQHDAAAEAFRVEDAN